MKFIRYSISLFCFFLSNQQKVNIIQLKTLPVKKLDVGFFDNANDFEVLIQNMPNVNFVSFIWFLDIAELCIKVATFYI